MTWLGIHETLVIGVGETRSHVVNSVGDAAAFTLFGREQDGSGRFLVSPTLINHGTLLASTTSPDGWGATVLGFHYNAFFDGVVVENHGVMSASSLHGDAQTIHSSSWSASILNSGLIEATALEGVAINIRSFSLDQPYGPFFKPFWIHNVVGGEILAEGSHAFGLIVTHANIVNAGTIHAIGHEVAGIGIRTTGGYIENDGAIRAEADPGEPSWAIAIGADNVGNPQRDTTIINRGSIEALTAIDELHDGGARTQIYNEGDITGAITLYNGDDRIRNTGAIDGVITLGAGADVYDGRGGTLVGSVFGGTGDDVINMGDHGGDAQGGDGVDTALADYSSHDVAVACAVAGSGLLITADGFAPLALDGFERIDIAGGGGYDNIATGATDDVIRLGRGGGFADAGAGDDRVTLDFSDRIGAVVYSHNNVQTTATVGGLAAAVVHNAEHAEVVGGAAADQLTGGAGDDVFAGGGGGDVLDGGAGFDIVSYVGSSQGVSVVLGGAAGGGDASGDTLANFEGLIGSNQDDALYGDNHANFLDGGAGSDLLSGGGGDDTYVVDEVGDVVVEGVNGGNDTVISLVGIVLATGIENLELLGTADINADGNDLDNIIIANAGNNILSGGAGADQIDGGDGFDSLSYAASPEAVSVTMGVGTGSGGDAEGDQFWWIELVIGSGFNDTLTGAHLQDFFEGGPGADTINGMDHYDTASYEHSGSGVSINLSANTISGGDAEGDSLLSIEGLIGSAFNDVLIGTTISNGLEGRAGDDVLSGRGGDDHMDGGTGFDTVSYEASNAGVTIDLQRGLAAFWGEDTLVDIEGAIGSNFGDLIIGSNQANTLSGLDGTDTLNGGGGADTLDGGAGTDQLFGEEGDDTIFWDAGDDLANVQGGAGTDTLVFTGVAAPTSFNLSSHGFELAEARFIVAGAAFSHFYDSQWRLSHEIGEADSGASWYIDWDETNSAPYQRLNQDFDVNGVLAREYGLSDNGSTWNQYFDTGNTQPWVSLLQVHTADGVFATESGVADNGSTWTTFYDVDGTNPFVWIQQVRDASGVLAQEEGLADVGSRWFTDWDETGTADFEFYENIYDDQGRLTSQSGRYDTGYTWIIDYDETGAHSWASVRHDYDQNGVLIGTTYTPDGP